MRAEPQHGLGGDAAHHAAYLDFYRATCIEKCRSLSEDDLTASRLPSGWTPLELLHHVAHMERRWLTWGFLGEQVDAPWGDSGGAGDEPWQVPAGVALEDVVGMLERQGARTRQVLAGHALDEVASADGRFADAGPEGRPDLRWICFHVLQEYARHAGHLDVAVELAGGPVGE
ncbi:mycothiol transferase [Nocardioides sp. MAHUQ-72]|uniref:mycothiol transferase n=1 Tax=unclassified Nocardioides TaxID=2615069 RepID=UPI00360EE3FD